MCHALYYLYMDFPTSYFRLWLVEVVMVLMFYTKYSSVSDCRRRKDIGVPALPR
jgi:hypothetical protein